MRKKERRNQRREFDHIVGLGACINKWQKTLHMAPAQKNDLLWVKVGAMVDGAAAHGAAAHGAVAPWALVRRFGAAGGAELRSSYLVDRDWSEKSWAER